VKKVLNVIEIQYGGLLVRKDVQMAGDVTLEVRRFRMVISSLLFFSIAIPCTKAVAEMENEVERLKDDERINGFAILQLCIAEKSCTKKRDLDNPSWLDNVLNAFVQPYIDKDGDWPNVIEECRNMYNSIFLIDAKYRCQELMADYHISNDLQNALNEHGCGTEKDWDTIAEYIKSCVDESDMNGFYKLVAKVKVIGNRDSVREKCIEHRESLGLQIEF
jgi:hypothetical protein